MQNNTANSSAVRFEGDGVAGRHGVGSGGPRSLGLATDESAAGVEQVRALDAHLQLAQFGERLVLRPLAYSGLANPKELSEVFVEPESECPADFELGHSHEPSLFQ